VDPHGEIVEHELNLPFVYLRSVVDDLFTSSNGEGWSSELIRVRALTGTHPEPHSLVEEQFISMPRFEHRGKMAELLSNRK
jgi:hypothetical protein